MTRHPQGPKPEPEAAQAVFDHDTCLYRGEGGVEARVFHKGEEIPAKSEGWRDHPANKEPTP